MSADPNEPRMAMRRRVRKSALIGHALFVVVIVSIFVVQISTQAMTDPKTSDWQGSCHAGLVLLSRSLDRGLGVGRQSTLAETEALREFNAALQPEWSRLDSVQRACATDTERMEALDAIVRLRYAEENAVRRNSADIGPLRLRARQLLERVTSDSAGPR